SVLDDFFGGIAFQHDATHSDTLGRTTREGSEVRGSLFCDLAGQVGRAGIGYGFEGSVIRQRRHYHVKQNDFTVEVTGKDLNILHRAPAPWGKLHGDENSG